MKKKKRKGDRSVSWSRSISGESNNSGENEGEIGEDEVKIKGSDESSGFLFHFYY
jgi:hypothetical protein